MKQSNHRIFFLQICVPFICVISLLPNVCLALGDGVVSCHKYENSDCKCKTSSNVVIDLSPLADSTTNPLFPDIATRTNTSYLYSFKPCGTPFTEGTGCTNVAACQVTASDKTITYNIGIQSTAVFYGEPGKDDFYIQYIGSKIDQTPKNRTTNVYLVCSDDEKKLAVKGEDPKGSGVYSMTLSTKYACVKGAHGLSVGSILLIVFFVLVFVYLVGGALCLRFGRGARGVEQIPNYEFWVELPSLIKDGVMFVMRGCKSDGDQTYEKI